MSTGRRVADTAKTTLFAPEWPKGSMRVLRNRGANEWAGRESEVSLIPPRLLVIGTTRFAGVPDPMPKFGAILPTPDTRPSETRVRSRAKAKGGEGG